LAIMMEEVKSRKFELIEKRTDLKKGKPVD